MGLKFISVYGDVQEFISKGWDKIGWDEIDWDKIKWEEIEAGNERTK